ncbi:toxin-antitoxin system toxin RelE/ParE family protein (plasmid) [Rhizobium sp. NXC24]|nr:type II toxin-antitoxin system RelE/ParE family toxin [Rhizobium sp. NXC24]AVA24995.1 toxin-antitoxin system toxin RelE/ParE family protein [Rhizobium sp. NXC24]
MDYRIRLHELAEAELDKIFDDITAEAGPIIAGYIGGIYNMIDGFPTFPERGTVREGPVPGLRIVGCRRTTSIAFIVEGDQVTILGVFRRGRNVTADLLKNRL